MTEPEIDAKIEEIRQRGYIERWEQEWVLDQLQAARRKFANAVAVGYPEEMVPAPNKMEAK